MHLGTSYCIFRELHKNMVHLRNIWGNFKLIKPLLLLAHWQIGLKLNSIKLLNKLNYC